jgi:hypothetical protein
MLVHAPALTARRGGTRRTVRVALTAHAVERYIERVQPGADAAGARTQIARLFAMGVIESRPATWDRSVRPAPLYLTVGDVSFVLDVDRRNSGRLVAQTCVTRGLGRSRGRRRVLRPRGPRPPYRRPAPGQLCFETHY